MTKPISTRTHGMLDLLTVGFALAFPRLTGASSRLSNAVTCLALGKLAYGMMTRHELSIARIIPMKAHLALDTVGGAGLCALPFMLDEDDPAATVCCISMGLFDIAAAPLTDTTDKYHSAAPGRAVKGNPRARRVLSRLNPAGAHGSQPQHAHVAAANNTGTHPG